MPPNIQKFPLKSVQTADELLASGIERAIREPIRQAVQADGRIRRWAQIPEADGGYLRVVLLEDGETVNNAFFDRGFVP